MRQRILFASIGRRDHINYKKGGGGMAFGWVFLKGGS